MDFFEYASLASAFVSDKLWISYLVGGLCFAVVFVFQAVAMYTIAGREGYGKRWMAFVPFLNTYYIGVCGQKNRAFRSVDTRTLALAAAVLEGVLFVGYLVYNIAIAQLHAANCFIKVEEDMLLGTIETQRLVPELVPDNLKWAGWCSEYLYDYILWWVNMIYLFLKVLVLSAFFQTYASRRYFLFTITSVFFPIQGILFFTVRNNRGLNYRDYYYREQERQYRAYRQYTQNNPYNNNPYNNNPYDNGNYGGNQYSGGNGYNPPRGDDPYGGAYNGGAPQEKKKPDDPFGGLGS